MYTTKNFKTKKTLKEAVKKRQEFEIETAKILKKLCSMEYNKLQTDQEFCNYVSGVIQLLSHDHEHLTNSELESWLEEALQILEKYKTL